MGPVFFMCPGCGESLTDMDEDLDEPGVFYCLNCDWEGPDLTDAE